MIERRFSFARGRVFYGIVFALLLLSIGLRVVLTLHRRFNADEFQHLHASWLVYAGYLPYRDFWENHTPLLYYILAPAHSFLPEGVPLIFILRAALSATALVIVWLTYRLALLDHGRATALLSALVLSFSILFLQKTIEVRPDQFLVALWLTSLWICLRSQHTGKKSLHLISAGFLLGVGALFSPKALLCFAAAILTLAALVRVGNSEARWMSWFRFSFLYALGFMAPVGACLLVFWSHGALDLLLQSTFLDNLHYPKIRRPTFLLSMQHIVFFLLSFAGFGVCLRERRRYKSLHRSRILLAVPCVSLFLIFLFVMPAPFPQSALIFTPLLAIYGGIALKKSIDHLLISGRSPTGNQKLLFAAALIAAVIVPIASLLVDQPSTGSNSGQLQLINTVLKHTDRRDVMFDGNAAYVFRQQAYYYGSLVEAVRERIARGEIRRSIPDSLKKNGCKFVIYDDRVSQLPGSVQEFLRNNYIETSFPDLLIAGRLLSAGNFTGTRAKFRIEIAAPYEIHVDQSKRFTIDGRIYRSSVFLKRGIHVIVADRPLRRIIVRAAWK